VGKYGTHENRERLRQIRAKILEFFHPRHNSGTDGVEVNIAYEFLQVGVFLADDGFVSILKKLATALIAAVKADGVTRKQSSHERGKVGEPCAKKNMGVIGEKNPCVTGGLGLGQELRESLQEILPVPVVYEDLSTLYTPDHDVVQDTGRAQTGLRTSSAAPQAFSSCESSKKKAQHKWCQAGLKPLSSSITSQGTDWQSH